MAKTSKTKKLTTAPKALQIALETSAQQVQKLAADSGVKVPFSKPKTTCNAAAKWWVEVTSTFKRYKLTSCSRPYSFG